MVSLSRNPISRNKSLHPISDFKHNTRIAIARVSGKIRLPTRFTSINVIVYLRTDTDGRVLVLYEYTIIRHRMKFILRKCDLPVIGVYECLCTQGINCGDVNRYTDLHLKRI